MAANTGILTYNSGVFEVNKTYYTPTVSIPATGKKLGTLYCFLSKIDPWSNESVPPAPEQNQKYLKQVFKNMFVAKQITTNDMSPVIERIDWASGDLYDYYRDDVDMFTLELNGTIAKRFYVRNRYDQVFKCLWNNNGEVSTDEPRFEPGTFNANQIYQGTDSYKWKYMYTISSGSKQKFMDDAWMPVPVSNTAPNPVDTTKSYGSLDVINVTAGGSNYNSSNSPVIISITGDGVGASANATISNGQVVDVVVSNSGNNYTYANVAITSGQGSGATAVVYTSPIGGHGFNPISELGTRHIMLTTKFTKDESGQLPTDIDFRQIGILANPSAYFGTSVGQANADIYRTTTIYVVSAGLGAFTPDEIVYQSVDGSLENAHFRGTVLSFDDTTHIVKLINIQGAVTINTLLIGNTSATARVTLQEQLPTFIPFSGYMVYLENREAIQRNADGSEQIRLVLGY
jgi:hypothetical protein